MGASGIDELPAELRQKWAAARVWAAHHAPYLSSALLALDPVVIDGSEGSPLDLCRFPADVAWHIYVDPDVLAALDVPQIGFWLIHQVTHLLREHAERFPAKRAHQEQAEGLMALSRTREQERWNLATDAEIDDDLVEEVSWVPDNAVTPDRLNLPEGGIAEQYWDSLSNSSEPVPNDVADSDCGSGCDGEPRPWDCDWPGLSKLGAKLTARETAQRIREHARNREEIPAGWRRWADEVLEPTVNWRRQLAAHVRRGIGNVAGGVDFTYQRPSRRAASTPNIIMPSLRQPMPTVAMVLDTSGSMSDGMLGQALGEVTGVLRGLGIARHQLKLICCDAEAYAAQDMRSLRNIAETEIAGGGGTDLREGLAAAAKLHPRPDVIVVLTDGHTPWPASPPAGAQVLVGLMDPHGDVPKWADSVVVGDKHSEAA